MRTKILILGLVCFFIFSYCKKGLPTSPDFSDVQSLKINYFTVSPSQILYGESSMLSWSVSNALKVVIDYGIGTVGQTGVKEVSPSEPTTYTLTAYSEDDSVTRSTKLVVIPRAIIIIQRTKWQSDIEDRNNNRLWGCGYLVWLENIGNRTAISFQVYTKIYDLAGNLLDGKVYSSTYDLPPEEISDGHLIHWPYELGHCESIDHSKTEFEIAWENSE